MQFQSVSEETDTCDYAFYAKKHIEIKKASVCYSTNILINKITVQNKTWSIHRYFRKYAYTSAV